MRKIIIPVLLGLVVLLHPFDLFAATFCWTDGTSFFVLAGGKVNLKPFAGKFVSPVLGCHGTLTGAIVTIAPNTEAVSIEGNLPSPFCVNFALFATSTPDLNAPSGVFDNTENGTSDGTVILTKVDCATVPISPLTDGPADESALPATPSAGIPSR